MQALHIAKFAMSGIKKEVHHESFNALCNFIEV